MTSIFDRWTDLDPALALRRIEAAYGGAIFDKYSYLDPQRALRQIEDALDIELDDRVGLQNPSTLEAAIDAAVDTGSAPEWVPANAKIYIDLVNDRAWTEADGEVAIDTLLGTDANTQNWWDTSEYDPVNLTGDGYTRGTSPNLVLAAIGEARTKLVAGSTFALMFKQVSGSNALNWGLVSADGNKAVYFKAANDSATVVGRSQGGTPDQTISNFGGTINKVAVTLTPLRREFAADGSVSVSDVLTEDDYPTSGDSPLVAFYLVTEPDQALQSITIYDALPSTAGLSALSEIT